MQENIWRLKARTGASHGAAKAPEVSGGCAGVNEFQPHHARGRIGLRGATRFERTLWAAAAFGSTLMKICAMPVACKPYMVRPTAYTPDCVGVPAITPVAGFRLKPGGSPVAANEAGGAEATI